jgi:hypothetical protein
MTPVASWPKSACEPTPCCQISTVTPYAAASESTLSTSALTGSHSERSARASSRKVRTATASTTQTTSP